MFKNDNTYKILKIFLENSTTKFGLREISRMVSLAPASVKKYLQKLEKEKIIETTILKKNPAYNARRDEQKFKTFQKLSAIYELEESGLIKHLWQKICPETIILFGSYSKGDATEESDIDLFLITKRQEINISNFQKKIKQEIQIFTDKSENIPLTLKNNLINGIILRGYLRT